MNAGVRPAFLTLALARSARKTVTVNGRRFVPSRVFPSQQVRGAEEGQP